MKVYIVTMGEYSAYHIERVFLDKEKAEHWAEAQKDFTQPDYEEDIQVEEFETSDEAVEISGRKVPTYHFDEYYNFMGDECLAIPGKRVDDSRFGDGVCHYFSEKPITQQEADKILHDMRTQLKAKKEGLI